MQDRKSDKKPVKKGFWAGLVEKLDKKMEAMACSGGCGCSGSDKKDKKCC